MSRLYSQQPANSMMPGFVFHSLKAVEAVAQTAEVLAVVVRNTTEAGGCLVELQLNRAMADVAKQMAADGMAVPDRFKHLLPA